MSKLELTTTVSFKPLIKLSKKKLLLVENDWHHACLTYLDLIPDEDDRYTCYDYEDEDIIYIIKTYGVRPPKHFTMFWNKYCNGNANISDDNLYAIVTNM
jgi:hypothetical protein